jgi:hypothetical protein
MIGWRVRCTVEVNKCVANIVLKGMVNRVAALMVDSTFVERYGFSSVIGRGRSGA